MNIAGGGHSPSSYIHFIFSWRFFTSQSKSQQKKTQIFVQGPPSSGAPRDACLRIHRPACLDERHDDERLYKTM